MEKVTIIVSGMIAADPWQGGASWAVLQYVLGLRELGCDVLLIEPLMSPKKRAPDWDFASSDSAAYFRAVVAEFGLEDRAALVLAGTESTVGMDYGTLRDMARKAAAIFNVSGMLTDEALLAPIPCRIYLDLDPAFIQVWHSEYGIDMRMDAHTHFVTVGQSIGTADCPVPTCGRHWIPTAQPVVLSEWPVSSDVTLDALTTIGNWRGYGSVEFQGEHYGQKAHSLRPFFSLPRRSHENFAPALGIHPDETADLSALAENGWTLLDPAQVASTPANYRRFIQGAKGEFGIAKSGYVRSRCGWFSDRSACFLASGKPVIAQDTGFSRWLPVGEGALTFNTIDEAVVAIESFQRDYEIHTRAARRLAESHFDSAKVLRRLLEKAGITL